MGCTLAFPIPKIKEWQKLERIYAGFKTAMLHGDIFLDSKQLYPTQQLSFIYKPLNNKADSIVSIALNQQEVQWLIGLLWKSRIEISNDCNEFYLDQAPLFKYGLKVFIDDVIKGLS